MSADQRDTKIEEMVRNHVNEMYHDFGYDILMGAYHPDYDYDFEVISSIELTTTAQLTSYLSN